MKKAISLFIVLSLCALLFSSCGKKLEDDFVPPEIEKEVYTENFTDKNGNITTSLEFYYPAFGKNIEAKVKERIEKYFDEKKNDTVKNMKANVDNVRDYLDRFNIDGIEYTVIDFETGFADRNAISFEITSVTSTNPAKSEPVVRGVSFSLATGDKLSISLLSKTENCEEVIKNAIIQRANLTYSPNAVALSEEKQEKLNQLYEDDNFIYMGQGYSFIYSYSVLSEGAKNGTFYCPVYFKDIASVVMTPEEYNITVANPQ